MVLQQYGKLVLQQSGGEYLQGCTFGSIPMARVPNNETKRNLWLRDEIKAKRLL